MKKRFGVGRTSLVVVATIILTTLSINAADHFGSLKESLLGSVASSGTPKCSAGMVLVPFGERDFCIDMYENSPGKNCSYMDPANNEQTRINIEDVDCVPVSVAAASPWRNIARHQAESACARAGKRLPTNKEWYRAALGTPDPPNDWGSTGCNLGKNSASLPDPTGSRDRCVSSVGAFDMVGNVWEWVDGSVTLGQYGNRTVPSSGFVTSVDSDGVPVVTAANTDPAFNDDYFWADASQGVSGMIRGGYWGIDSDAGLYAINTVIPPTFTGTGAGFRCVK